MYYEKNNDHRGLLSSEILKKKIQSKYLPRRRWKTLYVIPDMGSRATGAVDPD